MQEALKKKFGGIWALHLQPTVSLVAWNFMEASYSHGELVRVDSLDIHVVQWLKCLGNDLVIWALGDIFSYNTMKCGTDVTKKKGKGLNLPQMGKKNTFHTFVERKHN